MRKGLLLALFLLSSFTAFTMEKDISHFFSPFTRSSVSLTPMQKLQTDKDTFEKWLWRTGWFSGGINRTAMQGGLPCSAYYIHDNPVKFLKYCYMQHLHEGAPRALHLYELYDLFLHGRYKINRTLFNKCKKARKNGYSALGAAILARGVSVEYKRKFIYLLLQYGFTLTDKDRGLIKVLLNQAISAEVLSLLHDKQEGNFSALPSDVRRCIVYYIAHLLKRKAWVSLIGK